MFFSRESTAGREATGRAAQTPPTPTSRHRFRPGFEGLEGRIAMTMPCTNPLSTCFLFKPIPETATLAEHIHVLLQIQFVQPTQTDPYHVQVQTIPATVGHVIDKHGNLIGFDPIHTHTADGVIHIESTVKRRFHLSDFFLIWGKVFNTQKILNHTATPGHPIKMYVAATNGTIANGYLPWITGDYHLQPNGSYGGLPLRDGEVILIVAY